MSTLCSMEQAQEQVVRFLSAPSTHQGATVDSLSTHGARIFLAGDLAFKLKRAVKYPFMDFSSVAKRRAALETELRLNRRTAPDLYLEVRAVRAAPGGSLSWDGDGTVVDWVLVMRRFDQDALLDSIAQRGALRVELAAALADTVVEMHRSAPIVRRDESAYFAATAMDNIKALAQSNFASKSLIELQGTLSTSCARLRDHLNARARDGFVRRCHGDLHLRNIVVLNGKPVPFDALEFDEELATGDVYYDLAFLLMDLEHRGFRSFASRLLSRYATRTDDFEGLSALPLFLATRAAVRAKVTMLGTLDSKNALSESQSYIDLALRCLRPSRPRLIAIGGLSGTGKSTVAQRLASEIPPLPGAIVLRSDVLRKQLRGVPETTRLTSDAYTSTATADIYQGLNARAARILNAGHSAIIDAVFATPEERTATERIGQECDVPFLGLWLEAPLETRQQRILHRTLDPSDADEAIAKRQETYDIGRLSWQKISAVGLPDECVRDCVSALNAVT